MLLFSVLDTLTQINAILPAALIEVAKIGDVIKRLRGPLGSEPDFVLNLLAISEENCEWAVNLSSIFIEFFKLKFCVSTYQSQTCY